MSNPRLTETSTQSDYELGIVLRFIGSELTCFRRKKNLSQQQLAELLEIPQSHLSKLENGLVDVKASTILKIATLFKIAPRELLPSKAKMETHAWHAGGWGLAREGEGLLKKEKRVERLSMRSTR